MIIKDIRIEELAHQGECRRLLCERIAKRCKARSAAAKEALLAKSISSTTPWSSFRFPAACDGILPTGQNP